MHHRSETTPQVDGRATARAGWAWALLGGCVLAALWPAWPPLAARLLALACALAAVAIAVRCRRLQRRAAADYVRGEATLAEAGERLRETRRIARIGEFRWELDGGRVRWSEETFVLYGQPPRPELHVDEILGWLHADDRAGVADAIGRAMHAPDPGADPPGHAFEARFRVVRPDGEVRTLHALAEWLDRTPGRRVLRGIQQDITELARTDEKLAAAQAQYQFLFEHNPLPMWVFDRETLRFLAVNDAMLRHYGYERAELLAGTMLDIRPAEQRAAVEAAARQPGAQRPQGEAWTHLRKDGSTLRAAIYNHDIVFDGRRARLVAAQDVTGLERSEERFRMVARATSDAVYDWDVVSGHLWWSDSFYALFGHSRQAMPPTLEAWESLIHADDRARVMASLSRAFEAGQQEWEEQYRFGRGDGSWAEVADRGFIQRDELGQVVRMVGGMLDVTERHREQADLRLLRRAVDATDNGIVIADARSDDQPIVYVNPAFEQITGYASAEIAGRNCRVLHGVDGDQPGVAAIRNAMHEERETRVVLRNYRRDGTMFWNEFRLAPVRDEAGALTHFVGVLTDVTERQRQEEQLAWRATHDDLTGLPNRQLLHDRLQHAILNAERYGRAAAVVFVDLDDFKLINDTLGHSAGDTALRTIAQRLREVVRDADTVGRFGGDEFVVVLTEHTDEAGVQAVIARIAAALAQPVELAGVPHLLTPSIGHCRYPQDGRDAETLLRHADLAMYQAKRQGRNRAVAYRAEFDGTVSQRLQLVSQLRDGLQRDEFVLAFQPLWGLAGEPRGLEALVRWRHPERGLLPPSDFIGVCEESGLIVELGRRVLREAARHHALLAATGLGHLRIAVNVSAAQFAHDLHGEVAAVVAEFALPPGALEIELTESVIMDNTDRAIDTMRRIAELGVGLSLDDFGTGYSSLAYLKRLPLDRLKIDRSFVQDLGHDLEDAAICASIIGLGHLLGLRTVAEGVETEQQCAWLRARGCDELQGFLLGRPMAFDALLPLLQAARVAGGDDIAAQPDIAR
ncbi:MAG TPA: EAL domain-containing protein [Xanthomonadaceae bacterium]|nr:EAL domain-containing protein [Xanthomonadaceae bacterium]